MKPLRTRKSWLEFNGICSGGGCCSAMREKERREGGASNSTLCRLTFFSRPKLASLFNRGKGECNFVTVLSPWQPFHPLSVLRLIGDRRGGDGIGSFEILLLQNIPPFVELIRGINWCKRFDRMRELEYSAHIVSKIYETIIIITIARLENWTRRLATSGDSYRIDSGRVRSFDNRSFLKTLIRN